MIANAMFLPHHLLPKSDAAETAPAPTAAAASAPIGDQPLEEG
jgi:hypothetical protein